MWPKVLFTPNDIITACEAAKAVGDINYESVFTIHPRSRSSTGGNATYFDLTARTPGKEGKLLLKFKDELFVGRIMPLSGVEFTRDPSRAPTLGVQQYPGGAQGPGPHESGDVAALLEQQKQSDYFRAIALLDEFFQAAVAKLLSQGTLCKKAGTPPEGGVRIKNDHIISLYQRAISMSARENPGQPLTNPITRIRLNFDEQGNPRKGTEYYDLSSRVPNPDAPGRYLYSNLKFDDEPFCARNVHKILPGSKISGIVDLSAVCASSMGISVPAAILCLYVELAAARRYSPADIFGDA